MLQRIYIYVICIDAGLPFPLTVTGWRPPEDEDEELEDDDARATNSSVGVGEANTEPTAANAATVVKVFILLQMWYDGYRINEG
jgi:hypothetical protein